MQIHSCLQEPALHLGALWREVPGFSLPHQCLQDNTPGTGEAEHRRWLGCQVPPPHWAGWDSQSPSLTVSLLLELALETSHTEFTDATELSILLDQGGLTARQITLFKSPQDEWMAWEGVVGLFYSPFPHF